MGNGNVASIGEVLALAGFFSLMLGFWLLTPNTGSLCSQPPGSNVPSCPTDYSPLVLPTVIGGALIVAGAWLFWGFKPHSWTSPVPHNHSPNEHLIKFSQPKILLEEYVQN